MSEKRFEVVLNEFDEVEYIMDKKLCEDKDFAEFMDFVEELAKENEQLQKETVFLAYWKRKAMTLLMQVRRLTPRMTDKEVIEFSKELEDE